MGAGSALAEPPQLIYKYIRPPGNVSTFTAELLTVGEEMIAMELTLDRETPLVIGGREVLGRGYRAVWFLKKGEGWDVAAVYRPDGDFSGYYVDILDPVYWLDADVGTLLPIVDLFLDLWIDPSGAYEVLDRDEFAEAVERGWLTEGQREHALRVLAELEEAVRSGTFPPPEVRRIAEQ